jgi:HepT-like protein
MIPHRSFATSLVAGIWSVSSDLSSKLKLGLEQLDTVRAQLAPLISLPADAQVGDIETAATCAMLHSFYTEIEKLLKLIALDFEALPASGAWHKELLNQMSKSTARRPAVISPGLVETLSEFLAFRHLFRGASIALMRWEKLSPLVSKVVPTYEQTEQEILAFIRHIEGAAG